MKNKIDLTFNFFVPLLEIINEENVRKPLEFLKTSEKLCKKLEQFYFEKKNKSKEDNHKDENQDFFVPKIGKVKLRLTTESYNYYRSTRAYICDKEPIRPVIAFVSNYIKWIIDENNLELLKPRKRVEIFPSLIGTITKKVSLEINNETKNIQEKIDIITRICNREKTSEKLDILSAVFTDYSTFHVKESSTHTMIEIDSETLKKLNFDFKNKKRIKIHDVYVVFLDFNKIVLIREKKCNKLLIERLKQSINLVSMFRVLADRAIDILDKDIFSEKHIEEKFEFFEYLIAVLEPTLYSSLENMKLLPKHYQRVLFKKSAEILAYDKYSKEIQIKVTNKIKTWELREQVMFLSRHNTVINRLKSKYKLEKDQVLEPALTEKQHIMLNYLIDKYTEDIISKGYAGLEVLTKTPFGSVSANRIRQEINPWLEKKEIDSDKITDYELKEKPPKMLAELNRKGLIIVKEPEVGRTKRLFYVNEADEYIQTRLRGIMRQI